MYSKKLQLLLRVLIVMIGAGLGAAVAALAVRVIKFIDPETVFSFGNLSLLYCGSVLAGGLIFLAIRYPLVSFMTTLGEKASQRIDQMTMGQIVSSVSGLLVGMLVAMLLSQMLGMMGSSAALTLTAAILYIVLGVLGWSVGLRREKDFAHFFASISENRLSKREAKVERKRFRLETSAARKKVLDTSALIDGRLPDVVRTGFLEGTLVLPCFVLNELRQVADSSDPIRRAKGKRGLENLEKLKEVGHVSLITDETDWTDTDDVDVKLLRLATKQKAAVVTDDFNLNRIASVSGIPVLNLNALAAALKPVYVTGEELNVMISKEGKEPSQGVGYLEDGTMIVVEGGNRHIGENLRVLVTGALQTNAGRMVFARPAT